MSYALRIVSHGLTRIRRLDPGLAGLRATAVTMTATLAAYAAALLLEHAEHLHTVILVQAVALTLTLSRTGPGTTPADRITALAVLPTVAVAAAETSALMSRHPVAGDTVFTALICATIAVRRFGPRATRAGTLAVLPLIAVLVTPPGGRAPGHDQDKWAGLVALIAVLCGLTARAIADRLRFTRPAAAFPPVPAPASGSRRLSASTRMSLQMGAAVGAGFAAGHLLFPQHWAWSVLTAFVVCSGARGRADVVHKGVLRTVGAAAGTAVATMIAGTFGPHDTRSIAVIFAVLAAATWLRPAGYAYWAGFVTAALSLLYGYFGQSAPDLLTTRLEAIVVGAVLGIAASWLILPIRSIDVLRRRTADALAALGEFLAAARQEPGHLADHQARFDGCLHRLEQIAGPLRAHRRLRRTVPHPADAIDAVRRCAAPVHTIARCAAEAGQVLTAPDIVRLNAAVTADLTRARLAVGRRPLTAAHPPAPAPAAPGPSPDERLRAALLELDAAVRSLPPIFAPADA
ncbi:FUSC family protein [Actinoallomurus sp. NPDC050550]|uniref:FUSC family protein n=1 Tax=Actinoallomurus sp. NPDC050550 TaxID=3154937 RepID=UPI0033EB395F